MIAMLYDGAFALAFGGLLLAAYEDFRDDGEISAWVVVVLLMLGLTIRVYDDGFTGWALLPASAMLAACIPAYLTRQFGVADVLLFVIVGLLVPDLMFLALFVIASVVIAGGVTLLLWRDRLIRSLNTPLPFVPFMFAGFVVASLTFLFA